jgi:hypothetical protein
MDLLMIVLRLLHIVGAIFWVGGGLLMIRFITPTIRMLGPEGIKFFDTLITKTPYNAAFAVAGLSTNIAGAIMYYKVSDGFDADWIETTNAIVLSIGAVAGLLALGHGMISIGPTIDKYAALVKEVGGGTPTPQQAALGEALANKLEARGTISLFFMIIAVFGMATWRYF